MIDRIKTENDVVVMREEDSTIMKADDVHVLSTFSAQGAETEVSSVAIHIIAKL
jgi:hypothetical protein